MADFDPLTIPAVMPAKVPRTKPDGLPTKNLVDWEEGLQAWMKSNVTNTNTRLNLVSEEVDGAYAAIETEAITRASEDEALASLLTVVQANVDTVAASVVIEATARATADSAMATQITTLNTNVGTNAAAISAEITARSNADSALASSITTVAAIANGASASGQVGIVAGATPGGATAAYYWYLTAGVAPIGMMALATPSGGAIGFYANQFTFTDSGSLVNVFTYSGGKFRFTGDVAIDGNLAVNGTFTAEKLASGVTFGGQIASAYVLDSAGLSVWVDHPDALSFNPQLDGRVMLLFRHYGQSIATSGSGPVETTYRIVRRKGGVDTAVTGWVINSSGGVGLTDFVYDVPGAGACQYVLQQQLSSLGGSVGAYITNTIFIRLGIIGSDR